MRAEDVPVDLFGQPIPGPPPVRPVTPHDAVRWERIVVLNKPHCAHCQMNASARVPVIALPCASWRRIGLTGSVLDLCVQHKALQQQRDGQFDRYVQWLAEPRDDLAQDPGVA